ncbi:MAG: LysR family transcriptional regulator, partial [Clostridia bacterium]
MIDFRHLTFLALCELKNYTKTAEFLHLTQPAITQHIQYLENYYGGKLINLSRGNFQLTKKGNLLKHYTQIMVADSKIIFEKINNSKDASQINFGATLTIGEFIMPQIINKIMLKNDYIHFN